MDVLFKLVWIIYLIILKLLKCLKNVIDDECI